MSFPPDFESPEIGELLKEKYDYMEVSIDYEDYLEERKQIVHPSLSSVIPYSSKKKIVLLYEKYDRSFAEEISQRFNTTSFWTEEELINTWDSVYEAVTLLHNHDLIHSNLNESCIVLSPDGNIKLVDCFISLNPLHYTSPEESRKKYICRESDIWALGIVFLQASTLKPLSFSNETRKIFSHRKIDMALKEIQNLYSEKWISLLRAMLDNDPTQRIPRILKWRSDYEDLDDLSKISKEEEIFVESNYKSNLQYDNPDISDRTNYESSKFNVSSNINNAEQKENSLNQSHASSKRLDDLTKKMENTMSRSKYARETVEKGGNTSFPGHIQNSLDSSNLTNNEFSQERQTIGKELPLSNLLKNVNVSSKTLRMNKEVENNSSSVIKYNDGYIYEGESLGEKREGFGILYDSHGNLVYKGEWANDTFHGTGTLHPNGKKAHENFYMDLNQSLDNFPWIEYTGQFSEGRRHGVGKIIFGNGNSYSGVFSEDKIEGVGIFSGEKTSVCEFSDDLLSSIILN